MCRTAMRIVLACVRQEFAAGTGSAAQACAIHTFRTSEYSSVVTGTTLLLILTWYVTGVFTNCANTCTHAGGDGAPTTSGDNSGTAGNDSHDDDKCADGEDLGQCGVQVGSGGRVSEREVKRRRRKAGAFDIDMEAVRAKADLFANMVVNAPFAAATSGGRENEAAAWQVYSGILKDETLWAGWPDAARNAWPIPVMQWIRLLGRMRAQYNSYGSFQNAVNAVCKVGTKMAHNMHVAECLKAGKDVAHASGPQAFDPRVLYSMQHRQMMDWIRRDGGVQVKHTEYINMEEARNGHKFTDHRALPGLQASACWNMENLSGGRRPRSLSALRVRHLSWRVTSVKCGKEEWKVPSLTYEFIDEKFMDKRGPRSVPEDFSHFANFERDGGLSSASYLYALFKARGLFVHADPLSTLRSGDAIDTHEWARDYFVYCYMEGDIFYDCIPLSPQAISDMTRTILKKMGRSMRGGRAHRHGAYTRPQMMNLLQNKGVALDPKTEGVVLRAAGWSSVHGPTTTRTTYESILLDRAVNPFGLFYGINLEDEVWHERLEEWMGRDIEPQTVIRHHDCRSMLPFIVRLRALHVEEVATARRTMNAAGLQLLHEALHGTSRVVLAQRECSIYAAWRRVIKYGSCGHLGSEMHKAVEAYNEHRIRYRDLARKNMDGERHAMVCAFLDACDAEGILLPVRSNGIRTAANVTRDNSAIVHLAARHIVDVALLPDAVNRVLCCTGDGPAQCVHFAERLYVFQHLADSGEE